MKFPRAYSILEIAELCKAEIIGDDSISLTGMNEIHKLEPGDLMFVDNEKYFARSLSSIASAVIINKRIDPPANKDVYKRQPVFFERWLSIKSTPRSGKERISPFLIKLCSAQKCKCRTATV